jgi:hypothetical protein
MKFPQLLYYRENTHKGAKQLIYLFKKKILWQKSAEKSPMKTYMVKRAFWKISKKKTKLPHFQEGKKKRILKLPHFEEEKIGFEITEICGRFGQIPSFLLLKRVYEGRANPSGYL